MQPLCFCLNDMPVRRLYKWGRGIRVEEEEEEKEKVMCRTVPYYVLSRLKS